MHSNLQSASCRPYTISPTTTCPERYHLYQNVNAHVLDNSSGAHPHHQHQSSSLQHPHHGVYQSTLSNGVDNQPAVWPLRQDSRVQSDPRWHAPHLYVTPSAVPSIGHPVATHPPPTIAPRTGLYRHPTIVSYSQPTVISDHISTSSGGTHSNPTVLSQNGHPEQRAQATHLYSSPQRDAIGRSGTRCVYSCFPIFDCNIRT
ncbi:unnamed protein product [Dicrocoelium dendriticum]|nr:unnamed protein product [Dicrocoelium dendriticum]